MRSRRVWMRPSAGEWDLTECEWDLNDCGRDLAKMLESLTSNAKVALVLGSIPASLDTVESEGRQMKQFWINRLQYLLATILVCGTLLIACYWRPLRCPLQAAVRLAWNRFLGSINVYKYGLSNDWPLLQMVPGTGIFWQIGSRKGNGSVRPWDPRPIPGSWINVPCFRSIPFCDSPRVCTNLKIKPRIPYGHKMVEQHSRLGFRTRKMPLIC
jgi:hypothetical protein